jgi:hypothetical protein
MARCEIEGRIIVDCGDDLGCGIICDADPGDGTGGGPPTPAGDTKVACAFVLVTRR